MAMLMGGPPPPPPEPIVLDAGWDGVGGHARVVRRLLCQSSCKIPQQQRRMQPQTESETGEADLWRQMSSTAAPMSANQR